MKNLSAFPRFPLSEALMILITLVVCLTGFTKAEVDTNCRKEDPNQQKNENSLLKEVSFLENSPYAHQASETRGHESRGKKFANLKNFPESPLDRPIKRHSDYFGESDVYDSEKESDGYGYDDDEYYHFNYKRNDEANEKIENNKLNKETANEAKEKGFNTIISNNGNPLCKTNKDNQEFQTIEMLNFKETHPVVSQENPDNPQSAKPIPDSIARQKIPSTNPVSSLSGIDFKENSAIDENNKERKEDSGVLTASDSKIADSKKGIKANDEKDTSKLVKDSKLEDDSEKKEKEVALKDGKDSIAAKSLKDSSKTSEEKEKAVKLSDNAKLKENLEKISSKSKDNESTKLAKEDKDTEKFSDKVNSDVFNANELSQITSGASFVSNDYKDNLDAIKSIGSQGDQKNSEESHEVDRNIGLSEYQEDAKESQEKIKEKQFNLIKNEKAKNYDLLNGQSNLIRMLQGSGKTNPYSKSQSNFDIQNSNNFFRRREPWKEAGKISAKLSQDVQGVQQQQQQQIKQEQQQLDLESQMKRTFSSLPPNELENTEYHKNFMKSLKKYKAQNDNSKSSNDMGSYMASETTNIRAQDANKKKKRSKPKKRSMLWEKNLENEDKFRNEHWNQRRNTYSPDASLSDPLPQCLKKPQNSQSLHPTKTAKQETKLSDGKMHFDQWDSNRQRRKSPQKLEYEIKIFNQNQPDAKNAKFSHFAADRLKKDVKTKLNTEGKYLKKYPYSQVSRDDLTRISNLAKSESEKSPIWKRDEQKSIIQIRALPSGYYSNRVKFGQKSYDRNNEKAIPDSSTEEVNRLSQTYFSQTPSEPSKSSLQRAWEVKRPNYKHEPSKRFDENHYLNMCNSGNPLLLVKKGEGMAKIFQEGNQPKQTNVNEMSSDQFSKILPEDRNYVYFRKTDTDKLRNSETEASPLNLNTFGGPSYTDKKLSFLETPPSGILSTNNGRQNSLKGLHIRSSHPEKSDKKFISAFHSIGTKSNLKKTFEKFRDLAGFFKDNEQESTDNQYSPQEAKEGQDIVFSQDKIPDPIVITNDDSNKNSGFRHEPVNSIYSISNNFKNIDQQNKKIDYPSNSEDSRNFLASEVKSNNLESSWKPALKQAFPEAKSINSVNKNGNEIIVLDLNSNQLKFEHGYNPLRTLPKGQSQTRGSVRSPSLRTSVSIPTNQLAYKKQNLMLQDVPLVFQFSPSAFSDENKVENKMNLLSNDRAVAIIRSADNQIQIPGSLRELAELPGLLKKFMNKMPLELKSSVKLVNRKSVNERPENGVSKNYNQFLKDFGKMSEIKKKKEITLPQTRFSAYDDTNIDNLGNILQRLLNPVSPMTVNFEGLSFDNSKNPYGNQKSDQLYRNTAGYQPDFKSQGRWSSAQEKGKDFIPFSQTKSANGPKVGEEISNILRLDGARWSEESNENELWKELAAASEKIHRLRREGMETEKLKKTIEDALSFKETRDSTDSKEFSDLKEESKSKKYSSGSAALESEQKSSISKELEENGKDLDLDQIKETAEAKDSSGSESSSKSDYENHLSELFENLSSNKNQKNSSENTWNKKKRKDTSRRKRFSKRAVSNKVSKTEVQNSVLKNLAEDNYRSVYSPGIKRRLLSTNIELEDAENNKNEHKQVNNFNSQESQEKCVKNSANKCIDPMIVKLFLADGNEAEKNRARRSLTSGFHSNFKREIDLDESMPNDFQSFLVTSLGGFGSQKREVVKKGEALWEGKEMTQDNYNQIAENGKDATEDYAVEKREVSPSENRKSQSYKNPEYFKNGNQGSSLADAPLISHADKKARSDTALIKLEPTKYTDEKLPTRIRIQITNASSKEKKSSKPIMDENETTSTEMENLPKEKEFFDKNKLNSLLSKNYPKLRQHPGATYTSSELEEIVSKNIDARRKPFHPHLWRERKKKKCTAENPMKPVQDFNSFDQKAMESLLRGYKLNLDSDQTTQKISMNNRLPQVETVYNPTQGGNKAQIENSRLTKTNNIKNKDALNTKSNLQSNGDSSYDEGFLKPYFKIEEIKSDKGYMKDFEDPDWKTYNGRINLEQEPFGANSPIIKTQNGDSFLFSSSDTSSLNFDKLRPNPSGQKWSQTPSSNYFYHAPSTSVLNSQVLYDVMKLKQQMKNRNAIEKENLDLKPFSKPLYSGETEGQENLQKSKSTLPSLPNWLDGTSNNLDYSLGKGLFGEFPEYKLFDSSGLKNQNPRDFGFLKHGYPADGTYTKNLFEKPSSVDSPQAISIDNSKDTDYLDTLEDEYADAETNKEPQTDEGLFKNSFKQTNKVHDTPFARRLYNYKNFKNNYKNSELDENSNEDEEEFDEEYEENNEDEDPEDYSQFGYKKEVQPEMTRLPQGNLKLQNGFLGDPDNSYYNYYYPEPKGNSFEQTMYNSKPEIQSDLLVPVEEIKIEADRISGSNDLLKKANEKTNIFGKNLMKKLYRPAYDEVLNPLNKFQNEKASEDTYPILGNKLRKRKLDLQEPKEDNQNSQIGSRMFYAAKIEVNNDEDLDPSTKLLLGNKRNSRHLYHGSPEKNPFYAEFAGEENDFDRESEENEVRFNDNLMSLEKSGISHSEKNLSDLTDKSTRKDEKLENVEDVEENLEDGGEDNVLENVIGKYIMRKRIKSPTDLLKASEEPVKLKDTDKKLSEDSVKHKLGKRSVAQEGFGERPPKILKKRLSSGHLTENNFRKYHKKNPAQKRHATDLVASSASYAITGLFNEEENNMNKEEAKDPIKRSALDLFRKITSKEKDNKKIENAEGRSAGFEPLLSLNDKSKGFIKDPKDTVSLQEKQSSKDNAQAEMKSNPPELKAHYPNEGQRMRAQLSDKKKVKAKEVEQDRMTASAQGPWKVELNDKYDRSDMKKEKGLKTFKETEKAAFNDPNALYKAFLVISNNMKAAELNPQSSFPPTSGSFHREVGSSYRIKSDECRRIPINHVRKRSLKSFINRMKTNDEVPAHASEDRILKESYIENDISAQEKNRALHDTKSLPEGDSNFQESRLMQKNNKKFKSFVTSDEENQNSQFFSKGRLINRKSVFPPSSDANIIRDSRHINEETSEYHSQRIVDAILSQVSVNSKFKELIAPGLAMKTPAYREGTDSKSKAAAEMNFSEELQSFLQKFMFDLENLAEQHVKKRMCHKIDKDLKQFLQSLLSIPIGNVKHNDIVNAREECTLLPLVDEPEKKNLSQVDLSFYKAKQNVLDDLKTKRHLLKKLIENYQNLSELEKEALDKSYPYLLHQLEHAKAKLGPSESEPCLVQNSDYCENCCNNTNLAFNNFDFNKEKFQTRNETSHYESSEALKTPKAEEYSIKLNPGAEMKVTPETETPLPVFCFSEIKNPNEEPTTTPSSVFENIVSANTTTSPKNDSNTTKKQSEIPSEFKNLQLKNPTPESFDLLSFQSSTRQPDIFSPTKGTESIRIKQSLTGNKPLEKSHRDKNVKFEDFVNQPHGRSAELHKLSLGDAAGLELALKNQNSWVSNLEVAKTFRSVPNKLESKTISSLEKGGNRFSKRYSDPTKNIPSAEDFKNPRNLIASYSENSDSNFKIKNFKYQFKKPPVICAKDKKIYIPKIRPFDGVNKNFFFRSDCPKCRPQYVFLRVSLPRPMKRTYVRPKAFAQPCNQRKQYRESNFSKRKPWKKRKNVVPRFLTHHLKKGKEVANTKDLKTNKL